jgi:hypothetical protein
MKQLKRISSLFNVPIIHAGRFGYAFALLGLWFAGNVVGWTLIVAETLRIYGLSSLVALMLADGVLMLVGAALSGYFKFTAKPKVCSARGRHGACSRGLKLRTSSGRFWARGGFCCF